jgi:hypothetical protein
MDIRRFFMAIAAVVLTSIGGPEFCDAQSQPNPGAQPDQGLLGSESQGNFERFPPRPIRPTFIPKVQVTSSPVPSPDHGKTSEEDGAAKAKIDLKAVDTVIEKTN